MTTNKYGQAAIEAAKNSGIEGPLAAWQQAVQKAFPSSPSSQKKGCPKGAFLGLCEEGFVAGIASGKYARSTKNKAYAVRAVTLLKEGIIPKSPTDLWHRVVEDKDVHYNNQCDVVIAL